jgi:hypothetical protein
MDHSAILCSCVDAYTQLGDMHSCCVARSTVSRTQVMQGLPGHSRSTVLLSTEGWMPPTNTNMVLVSPARAHIGHCCGDLVSDGRHTAMVASCMQRHTDNNGLQLHIMLLLWNIQRMLCMYMAPAWIISACSSTADPAAAAAAAAAAGCTTDAERYYFTARFDPLVPEPRSGAATGTAHVRSVTSAQALGAGKESCCNVTHLHLSAACTKSSSDYPGS